MQTMETIMQTNPKFVYCLKFTPGSARCDMYLDKEDAIVALIKHYDRFCYSVDTFDTQKHSYVKTEMLYELLDEKDIDDFLVKHPDLKDQTTMLKEFYAETRRMNSDVSDDDE